MTEDERKEEQERARIWANAFRVEFALALLSVAGAFWFMQWMGWL